MNVSKATWPQVHLFGVYVTTCFVKPTDGCQELVCGAGGEKIVSFSQSMLRMLFKSRVGFFVNTSDGTKYLAAMGALLASPAFL